MRDNIGDAEKTFLASKSRGETGYQTTEARRSSVGAPEYGRKGHGGWSRHGNTRGRGLMRTEMAVGALDVAPAFTSVPVGLAWRALKWKMGTRRAFPVLRLLIGTGVGLGWGVFTDPRPIPML